MEKRTSSARAAILRRWPALAAPATALVLLGALSMGSSSPMDERHSIARGAERQSTPVEAVPQPEDGDGDGEDHLFVRCPVDAPESNFTDRAEIAAVHVGAVDCAAALKIIEGFADPE